MKHHSYIQFQKTNGPVSQVKCSKVTNVNIIDFQQISWNFPQNQSIEIGQLGQLQGLFAIP